MPTIGIDIGGSDKGQSLLLDAIITMHPHIDAAIVLYSTLQIPEIAPTVTVKRCESVIEMGESSVAVRHKTNSTLNTGLRDVRDGVTDGFITFAQTGALVIGASFYTKRIDAIHRPALLAELPTPSHSVVLIDAGAITSPTTEDICSYSIMGTIYAHKVLHIKKPKIGLLNIGKEANKGSPEIIMANTHLSLYYNHHAQQFGEYIGTIEPYDVLSGAVDVCVAHGVYGNIFLKTAEAAAKLSKSTSLRHEQKAALLAGINAYVLKCHGEGSVEALYTAIHQTNALIKTSFLDSLQKELSSCILNLHL